jgi:hypothetical protein
MVSLTDAGATHNGGVPVADFHDSLSNDSDNDYEVIAAIRAIPAHKRGELLAGLQALLCTDTTHTVKASFRA